VKALFGVDGLCARVPPRVFVQVSPVIGNNVRLGFSMGSINDRQN
jgi:hypothetical protein